MAANDDSDTDERRTSQRCPIELKVEYRRLNTFFADYTRNISRGGTFIKTKRPLEVGTEFMFKLTVPYLPEPIALRGQVQWIRQEGEHGSKPGQADPGMGIRFLFDDESERQSIEQTVGKLMADSLGPAISSKLIGKE